MSDNSSSSSGSQPHIDLFFKEKERDLPRKSKEACKKALSEKTHLYYSDSEEELSQETTKNSNAGISPSSIPEVVSK
jgi:hypothetical protein